MRKPHECAPAPPLGQFCTILNRGKRGGSKKGAHATAVNQADESEGAAVIRVLLVHDASLVRTALAEWLRREPDLGVSEACWRSAGARARSLRPDVCAADLGSLDSYGLPPLDEL